MMLLARISLPLVWLLDRSGKALLWLLGHRGEAEEKVSEDEIRTLVVEAENAGVLEPGEKEMIAGVMRLGDLPVGAVMTPRHEVSMIDLDDPPAEVVDACAGSTHSRFPVFDGNRDHAVGIVNAKDLLDEYLAGRRRISANWSATRRSSRRPSMRGTSSRSCATRPCTWALFTTSTAPSRAS